MKNIKIFLVILMQLIGLTGCNVKTSAFNERSKVEYCSETNAKFYQQMVNMKRGSEIIYNGFPACLTRIFNIHDGDVIFNTESDTLSLVYRDLNRQDINKYHYYVIKDNHNNIWTLFRHNDEFELTRLDEKKYAFLLEEDVEQ